MINVYLNKMLCDIDIKRKDIVFKRMFLNPSSLNTEDRQRSYEIYLPKSPKNNRIFTFKNVEEVRGKFKNQYDAIVYINGLKVLEGKFILTKIDSKGYIGNLGVQLNKTTADIFKDRTMNQAGDWEINFGAFKESVEERNLAENPPCIFPYVLYGLIPKEKKTVENLYSAKNIWDDTVRLGMDDLPPSVNCLQMIRNIFEREGYNINGTAFGDERLSKLYVSYKNPADYEMVWNYARNGKIDLSVTYSNFRNENTRKANIEPTAIVNNLHTTELLSAVNSKVDIKSDDGNNILKTNITDYNTSYTRYGIIVPCTAVYKIKLNTKIELDVSKGKLGEYADKRKKIRVVGANLEKGKNTYLGNALYEIKLIRDKNEGEFDLTKMVIDRGFYSPRINQNNNFDKSKTENFPKYFPQPGKTMFIDAEQNGRLVCGISFGKSESPVKDGNEERSKCNPIAIKSGLSWNNENIEFTTAATKCNGYYQVYINEEGEIAYKQSNMYKVKMDSAEPYAEIEDNKTKGKGTIEMLMYLKKGERLSIVDQCSNVNYYLLDDAATAHTVTVDLTIEPYKDNEDWLFSYLNETGGSIEDTIPYKGDSDFLADHLNLTKFLPSDEKIDDWLSNFCKAFNLTLSQTGLKDFELNIKQVRQTSNKSVIDVKTHQNLRTNLDLNLPFSYALGFSIDEEEQGYYETNENGGGEYKTGVLSGKKLEQSSNFSYCWYKQLYDSDEKDFFKAPVISDHEVWKLESTRDYDEMQKKWYVSKPQRFWYKDGVIEVSGFREGTLKVAKVKNELSNNIKLDYHNETFSILRNFYTLFVDSDNCYTEIECYLTPDEYAKLPYSLVRFNGDLYYPAEIDNYDPYGNRRAKLKLIRKI